LAAVVSLTCADGNSIDQNLHQPVLGEAKDCVALFNVLFVNQPILKIRTAFRSLGCVSGNPPLRGGLEGLGIMNLEILTPERKLYSGEVYGVQMPGISGSFEVLEKHAPLVSALKAGRVKVLKDKQNHFSYFDIQGGFVEVLNNKVTVLVEGAVPVEE
jgi:F-type H+-transporting ATPase subunit epsilon